MANKYWNTVEKGANISKRYNTIFAAALGAYALVIPGPNVIATPLAVWNGAQAIGSAALESYAKKKKKV